MRKYKVCLYHNCKLESVWVFANEEKAKKVYEKVLSGILRFETDNGYRVSLKEFKED